MGHEVTLGGERLGGGKRNKVYLKGYERSTHNLSYAFRSTMSAGTLVPFMSKVALPGDTWDIDLEVACLTHPTIGPLFGTYKIHLDVFQAPIRLYHKQLMNNTLNIGNDMSKVLLPQVTLTGQTPDISKPLDNQQINPSCIFKYLGISGIGNQPDNSGTVPRQFNMVPWLAYWEIYKNYYSNKQEGIGAVIHNNPDPIVLTITGTTIPIVNADPNTAIPVNATPPGTTIYQFTAETRITVPVTILSQWTKPQNITFTIVGVGGLESQVTADRLFRDMQLELNADQIIFSNPTIDDSTWPGYPGGTIGIAKAFATTTGADRNSTPTIATFDLTNIDQAREALLVQSPATPFEFDSGTTLQPYGLALTSWTQTVGPPAIRRYALEYTQEGLGLRTYQSDLFNNWINTAWIDDPTTGITAVTAVTVTGGKFTLDELNLSKKVYEMLNRIAISGGTYDDWLDAVYTHDRHRIAMTPIYLGGAIRNIVFQEVIATAQNEQVSLGQLAGKGRMGPLEKGGKIIAKIDEPSYIIGIVSIVPQIDYSQGNEWDVNLKTMNDLHKPALDEIGFQNLITDQMAWWDTQMNGQTLVPVFRTAGKQPAWINYMTSVNKVFGNFADETQQMFMVLTRQYTPQYITGTIRIQDLTTYIDPTKFNNVFADTRLDAQNFWMQIGVGLDVRRKMSAKVIPNL